MRFPRAAIIFLVTAFVFMFMWGVSTRMITEFRDAVDPFDDNLGSTYDDEVSIIPVAFGVISAFMFVMVVVVFFLDALGEEYEYYPRRRDEP